MENSGKQGLLKALVSDAAMDRLYRLRQEARRTDGVRHRYAIVIALALALITTALIVNVAWVPQDQKIYIDSRADISLVPYEKLTWQSSGLQPVACQVGLNCLASMQTASTLTPSSVEAIGQLSNNSSELQYVWNRLEFSRSELGHLATYPVVVFSLPHFRHQAAALYLNGNRVQRYYRGERLEFRLQATELPEQIAFDIVFEVQPSDRSIAGTRNRGGMIVASQSEFSRFRNFLGSIATNGAGEMGRVAKIVLALFCLLLFLIVDSSPESFGLALFMGFEAAAMGIGKGWLPLGYLGIGHESAITNFCYQMGDLLKLYFLLQIARIGRPNPLPWLVIGAAVSVPYGFFMEWAGQNSISWVYKIPRTRDTIVGTVGCVACLRALWVVRGQSLPWRKLALMVAASAAALEVINTWIAHSDLSRIYPSVRSTFSVLQANAGYLFALSTFLNISSLENRVRMLSRAKARADEIERELEVGQLVQNALLKTPTLPDGVTLNCHHEAALYVSGDTYYAYWDRDAEIVSFLVNDVTGHGVQAALKASACNVIAKTIWEDGRGTEEARGEGKRLAEYDRLTTDLLVEMNRTPDFNSLIGAEFDYKTGELWLYRSNFTFPVIVEPNEELTANLEPHLGEFWQPRVLASRNKEMQKIQLKRGSFVIFLSDGFMETSRETKQFSQYLRRNLASRDPYISGSALSDMILRFEEFKKRDVFDDRTLLVFQWGLDEDSAQAIGDDLRRNLRSVGVGSGSS